ncbi:unnamed protein product, partial [Sphacelaria rigidula]
MTNPTKTFCNKQRPAGYTRLDGRAHTDDILDDTTAPRNDTKNNNHTINGPHDHCNRSTLRYNGKHQRAQVRQEQDQVICPSMTNKNDSSTRRHHANTTSHIPTDRRRVEADPAVGSYAQVTLNVGRSDNNRTHAPREIRITPSAEEDPAFGSSEGTLNNGTSMLTSAKRANSITSDLRGAKDHRGAEEDPLSGSSE